MRIQTQMTAAFGVEYTQDGDGEICRKEFLLQVRCSRLLQCDDRNRELATAEAESLDLYA